MPPSKIYHVAFRPIVLEKLEDLLSMLGEVVFNSPLANEEVDVFTMLTFGCPAANAALALLLLIDTSNRILSSSSRVL